MSDEIPENEMKAVKDGLKSIIDEPAFDVFVRALLKRLQEKLQGGIK